MSLIFQNGSRTRSYGPGEKMPALPQQPKDSQPGVGKPPPIMTSSGQTQDYYYSKAGQAQSTPQPSKGTPYSAYAPNSSSSFATNTDGVNRTYKTNTYNNSDAGNFGNNPASRPPPFTQGATGLGGQSFSDPSQAFVQRDAMIDRLNTNKSQYTANAGVYQGDGAPPASFGQRPQYDFNSLMGQANDMVQQGWTNPFSQPAGQSQQAYYPGGEGGFPVQPDSRTQLMNSAAQGPYISTAGNRPPSYNNYGKGFGPGVPILKGPGPLTSSPVTPGSAQPIAPQQPPTGYNPGMPVRSAADSPTSPEYQKWRSGQAQTMEWRGPEGEAKREADMHRRWMEETGRAPASGDFRPKPGAPQGPRMPYAGGMDYEQGPPVVRPGLTLRPPPRRTGMAGYQTTRRR